jgi:hypothetical protein
MMLLLEAINNCLTALGEAHVTSASVRHPTVDLIRTTLVMKQRQLLETGYWFNTSEVTMYPSPTGEMAYPNKALSVLGYGGETFVPRGGMLFDMDNNTNVFTEPKTMLVFYDLDFEDLPECAANVIMTRTAQEVYSGDLGVDTAVQRMRTLEGESLATLQMLHLRNRRYSTKQRRGWGRLVSALRG